MLVQLGAGFVLGRADLHRDHVAGHQIADLLIGVIGKTDIAIGDDADQLARARRRGALDDGNAGDTVLGNQGAQIGERRIRRDRHRIDHHAALIALHPPNFLGLLGNGQIAVDHRQAASLRHRDRHTALGHGVHGGGEHGNLQRHIAGHARRDIGIGGKNFGRARLQEHIIEGETFTNLHGRLLIAACGAAIEWIRRCGKGWMRVVAEMSRYGKRWA